MPTATGQAPTTRTYQAVVAATAAAADFEVAVCTAPWAGVVTSLTYVADTTLTGANTESRTLSLVNKGLTGVGTVAPATKAFVSGVNATAFDETVITNSVTAADLDVVEGDVLVFKSLHIGATGLADPGGTAILTLTRL